MRGIARAFGRRFLPSSVLWRYRASYDAAIFEFKSLRGRVRRFFSRPALPHNDGNAVYLHLGCGQINHSKFINIDMLPAPHIHYVRSIDNLSIFRDCSVDLIYASHCLEHFPFHAVPSVLKEWHRVLRPNGILRLSVPDFDLLLDIYKKNDNDINQIIAPLMGGQDNKFNYHQTIFNREYLSSLLIGVGFHELREWGLGFSEFTTFDDWSNGKIVFRGKEYPVSLNLEAVK